MAAIARLAPLAFLALAAGCGGATLVMTNPTVPPKEPPRLTAVVASGAPADFPSRLEAELRSRGYGILDHVNTSALLTKLGAAEDAATNPQVLAALKIRRIDSVMKVVVQPTSESSKLLDKVELSLTSADGQILTSFVWTNSWGGAPTSGADSLMRLSVADAAREVAAALARQLGPPGVPATVLNEDTDERQAPAVSAAPAADVSAPGAVAAPAKPWWQ